MKRFLFLISKIIPDALFLKIKYFLRFHRMLNLKNPKGYNEKLQWLKLYDRKEIYTDMVDKYKAKEYVSNIIGDEYIIPTLGVYDNFDDIVFDNLPNKFVIKCTHDSGGLVIVRDKEKIDIESIKLKINKCLKRNYYYYGREWPYKNVKPRIIIEELLDDSNASIKDYKFFCFDGSSKLMYLSEGLENHETARMSFFDMDFNLSDCKRMDYKLLDYEPKKPINFDKMKKLSGLLSKNIPHLRVDWYEVNGRLYFGELTFFTCGGLIKFEDDKWNYILGDYIKLPK